MHFALKRSGPGPDEQADALRALSSLLRSGLSLHDALTEWSSEVESELVDAGLIDALRRVAALVALGATPTEAIAGLAQVFGDDIEVIVVAIDLHAAAGVDPVPVLGRTATAIERRAASQASGRAAAAGARLSGWMVGGLPLVSIPLLPMAHAPLFDPIGRAVLFLGMALTAIGMAWMGRLAPAPQPLDDPVACYMERVAMLLSTGLSLHPALELATKHAPPELRPVLGCALRRVHLGQPWATALEAVDPEAFGPLVRVLRRAERLGAPAVDALDALGRARRAETERRFDRELRRAPVLMVVPLVLCVLPAFGLIAVVPFLRAISLS